MAWRGRLVAAFVVAALVLLVQFAGFDGIRAWLMSRGLGLRAAADLVSALKGAIAALILGVAVLAPVYILRKNRADDAHLLALTGRGDEA